MKITLDTFCMILYSIKPFSNIFKKILAQTEKLLMITSLYKIYLEKAYCPELKIIWWNLNES